MANKEIFLNAAKKLARENGVNEFDAGVQAEYMSNMANWVVVHATKYMPIKLKNGTNAIPTTAMATDFNFARPTVHVTLNHIVHSHMLGNWDDMPIVVLAPYNSVVEKNGNPLQVAAADTFFAPDINTGLVLPENAHIVHPGVVPDGQLFVIRGNETIYKDDNYTDDEINQILSHVSQSQRDEYNRWNRGEPDAFETEQFMFMANDTIKQMYNSARDKRAFFRGVFENDRHTILMNMVRDVAVAQTMENMGFKTITAEYDDGIVANQVKKTADAGGVAGWGNDKGHQSSIVGQLEDEYNNIYTLFYGSAVLPVGLFNQSNDFETLYNFIDSELNDGRRQLMFDIIADLTEMRPLDLQKYLNTAFTDANEFAKTPAKTIGEYNKNVATSFGASINKLMSKYNMWRNDLKMRPGYSEFIARLRARLGNQLNMTRFGRGRE